jgi:hypothetical protein
MLEVVTIVAGLIAIGTAIVKISKYTHDKKPKSITDLAQKVFHLGELIENTYTHLQLARFDAASPALLAKRLRDSHESTAEIWNVAIETSGLSENQLREMKMLCQIFTKEPLDYAVFIAAVPLYKTWFKIKLIEKELTLSDDFSDETSALRNSSFNAISAETRSIAQKALQIKHSTQIQEHHYRVDLSYERLATTLGFSRTPTEASVFLAGAGLARINGAITVAKELQELANVSGTSMTGALERVLQPIDDTVNVLQDHINNFGLPKSELLRAPRSVNGEVTIYLDKWEKVNAQWRLQILKKLDG